MTRLKLLVFQQPGLKLLDFHFLLVDDVLGQHLGGVLAAVLQLQVGVFHGAAVVVHHQLGEIVIGVPMISIPPFAMPLTDYSTTTGTKLTFVTSITVSILALHDNTNPRSKAAES